MIPMTYSRLRTSAGKKSRMPRAGFVLLIAIKRRFYTTGRYFLKTHVSLYRFYQAQKSGVKLITPLFDFVGIFLFSFRSLMTTVTSSIIPAASLAFGKALK